MSDQKYSLKDAWYFIYYSILLIFSILSTIILGLISWYFFTRENQDNLFTSAFAILLTSIATASFFLIKIYIENQLSIKEDKMGNKFREDLKKDREESDRRINERFERIENTNRDIINALNSNYHNLSHGIKKNSENIEKIIERLDKR